MVHRGNSRVSPGFAGERGSDTYSQLPTPAGCTTCRTTRRAVERGPGAVRLRNPAIGCCLGWASSLLTTTSTACPRRPRPSLRRPRPRCPSSTSRVSHRRAPTPTPNPHPHPKTDIRPSLLLWRPQPISPSKNTSRPSSSPLSQKQGSESMHRTTSRPSSTPRPRASPC